MLKFRTKNNIKLTLLTTAILAVSCGKKEKEYFDTKYTKPEIVKEASSDFKSPKESLNSFYLPEGYEIQLVASEPMVDEPVTIAWDGNGRMYVAEMNTYMQDVDGTGTNRSISKIKQLIDTDGDGKMDKSTVFIDSLMLPRMILPLDNGELIVNETYSYDLWKYTDTNNDGVADVKKRVFHIPKRRGGNLEHQQSGLLWSLDNWTYTTYNPIRFKFTKDKVVADTVANMPAGQWGLTQDDLGNIFYATAGGENPAYGFQHPPVYGDYSPKERLEEGFMETFPIVGTPDVQGGPKRLKEDGTLNHFTGVAGQTIFRGHKMPSSMYGDLFIPEPVGRLIRRAKVNNIDGLKVLSNPYYQTEFLASTDLNFRPVWSETGPDGSLYVVDMYRGIIQESNWTRKGSAIRPVIKRKGLDKNIGRGRIYRIVHKDFTPDKQPKLLDKTSKELVSYLGHRNGWYRNTAQKLIILRADATVIPMLKEIALNNQSTWSKWFGEDDKDYGLERIHALWTLEGLEAIDKELIISKFKDEDPRVRMTAIRISENFLKKGATDLFQNYEKLALDPSTEVINQLALSLRFSDSKKATSMLKSIQRKHQEHQIIAHSAKESLKKDDERLVALKDKIKDRNNNHISNILRGYDSYNQLCITCHGPDLKGVQNEDGSLVAPPLLGSPRVKGDPKKLIKILLNGLIGEVDGKEYGVMMSLKDNDNFWIADVLSYVRAMNDEEALQAWAVGKVRNQTKDRKDYWTLKELNKSK
ncbi:mono/diheme cytochrome c family protein/glucose/arabinose dehydrogenase [Wenyingzhuangia heitensis]|uniref:Mono/diheme cytochrome c family protein/glucose/arabinose dehydrogenase n=1 Tax=Wenyingzhuangia heitensis TaxID=1487859 RepID=A0ABX0UBN4_9FLAO|nr:cytochrome C [Wenyingzhuangia heitensis]NIJ45693.1 mono/diheme cytochrome c family protein/glucose/arabinose dehydrogenase [Wenyingzhuangia heitensis]